MPLQQSCAGIFQSAMKVDTGSKGWLLLLLLSYKQSSKLWRAAAPLRQKRIRRVYINLKWRKNFTSQLYLSVFTAHCSWFLLSCWWVWPDPALGLGAPSKFGKCQRWGGSHLWECRKTVTKHISVCNKQIWAACTMQTLTVSRAWASLSLVEL